MKYLVTITAFVLTSAISTTAMAEKMDCQTLAELGASLEEVRTGLEGGGEVDDETYEVLGDMSTALRGVAELEGNNKLNKALDQLEAAHSDNDRDAYVSALNNIDTLFGAFYVSDCGE